MRQSSSTPRFQRFAQSLAAEIETSGDPTLVNGEATTAIWSDAQPGRATMYLNEEQRKAAFDVTFSGAVANAVLDAPYNLKNGSEVVWVTLNWRAVVRKLFPETQGGVILSITALVELTK